MSWLKDSSLLIKNEELKMKNFGCNSYGITDNKLDLKTPFGVFPLIIHSVFYIISSILKL